MIKEHDTAHGSVSLHCDVVACYAETDLFPGPREVVRSRAKTFGWRAYSVLTASKRGRVDACPSCVFKGLSRPLAFGESENTGGEA